MNSSSRCPLPTPHATAIPAVQFNRVYLTPCTTVPSINIAAASDKRYSLGCTMTSTDGNLAFTPRPIQAVGLRPAGVHVQVAQPVMQRMAALRAYSAFPSGRDWMEKLSHAYVVALATRSADTYLMRRIQSAIPESPPFTCAKCREATIGTGVIRKKLFPTLHSLREHANDLLHHLDNPDNQGVATLNVEGVFEYCFHLFDEQAALLFGECPDETLEFKTCKEHRQQPKAKV